MQARNGLPWCQNQSLISSIPRLSHVLFSVFFFCAVESQIHPFLSFSNLARISPNRNRCRRLSYPMSRRKCTY
ncbi:hypothetical protein F4680DRAFT_404444 [Xylaria scruposa]|nr:hypothetical protein F4680DRAFT_404444 [Xylaria scruposa]